jgi:hypothetical protein
MTAARSSARVDAERARQHATDRQTLTDVCAELRALWPQLQYAIAADTNSSDVIGRTPSGSRTPRLANEDVADTAHEFALWLIVVRGECVPLLHPDPIPYGSLQTLAVIPDWWEQLRHRNLPTAGYLYSDALRLQRHTRRALGLHTHDRPTGATCPEHPEQPAPLYWLGREGTLDGAILHSPAGKTTWRIPTGAITWTRSDTVRCPRCGQTWAGIAELNILARRLAGRTT